MTTTNNGASLSDTIEVKIELDNRKFICLHDISKNHSLTRLRQEINDATRNRTMGTFLDKQNYPISLKDEDKLCIKDIISQDNVIKMATQPEQEGKLRLPIPDIKYDWPISNECAPITTAEYRPAVIPSGERTNSGVEVCDLRTFGLQKWEDIFERCNLLCGISFDSTDLKPSLSPHRVCQFNTNMPFSEIGEHFKVFDGAHIEARLANNEIHHTMIVNHCFKLDANFQCPFVSFADKLNREKQQTNDNQTKTLRTTCSWVFPRVKIDLIDGETPLDKCYLRPTENFKKEVEEALQSKSEKQLSIEDMYRKLENIFTKYGCVYPKYVILGGKRFLTDVQSVDKNVDEEKHKLETMAKLSAELAKIIDSGGVGVGGGKQTSNLNRTENITHESFIRWTAVGGNTLQVNDVSAWPQSVGDSKFWRVIEYGDFIPTYKLLNNELQKEIEYILEVNEHMRKITAMKDILRVLETPNIKTLIEASKLPDNFLEKLKK